MTQIQELYEEGRQSVWLDYIRRDLIETGELERLIADGVRGVTSNPSIFEKAIGGSDDYDHSIAALLDEGIDDPPAIFERLAVDDIQGAADVLRPLYDSSDGEDGYVSLEVSPGLAHDEAGTVAEARRLWEQVARPNLMVKVPATTDGVAAVEALIAEGINVNATLIFSIEHYDAVARAYVRGLRRAAAPARVASVASLFVSRVDTAVDRQLEDLAIAEARALRGTVAVGNAKLAYGRYQDLFEGEGFAALRQRGARPQRLLWASTGTKNSAYSDVMYVEELVGPNTVNTVPPATLDAFLDHGQVRAGSLLSGVDGAAAARDLLASAGIDIDSITTELQHQGIASFTESFHQLMHAIDEKSRKLRARAEKSQALALGELGPIVAERVEAWADASFSRRLWSKDWTLWAEEEQPEITDRLGWLTLPETMHHVVDDYVALADEVRSAGIRHVVLLGMGGSSLAPEVYQRTFGNRPGHPELLVLDSTHPGAVQAVDDQIDPHASLFIVASKSGTTIEPLSFFRYFWQRVSEVASSPGDHFVAITDPGTPLIDLAKERGFRKIIEATPDVGGRYSALTAFGLVPAALIGVDVHRLIDRGGRMAEASAFCVPEAHNPALELGAALGVLARRKLDKATFLVSPSLAAFPSWVEQLIAESTGKEGRGILPVANEPPGDPDVYGDDRFFIYLDYIGDHDVEQAARVDALEAAGHPVARITLYEKEELGAEMFRAEFAVAAAGSVLRINPFNQPDVQLAKDLARRAMGGELGVGEIDEVRANEPESLSAALRAWLSGHRRGDYVAIQAYLNPTGAATAELQSIRLMLRDRLRAATTLGMGPRFLHSTGQFHKGGPNTGLFLQIVDEPSAGLTVPETDYTFNELIAAQALGDHQALVDRDRRVVRVNLGASGAVGLKQLKEALGD